MTFILLGSIVSRTRQGIWILRTRGQACGGTDLGLLIATCQRWLLLQKVVLQANDEGQHLCPRLGHPFLRLRSKALAIDKVH